MTLNLIKKITLILLLLTPTAMADQNDSWIGEPFSGFKDYKVVIGQKYMVSTADENASKAAKEMLENGGSAVDAAIAAQLVLNVVEPHSSGIGGGGFLLYYNNKTKKTEYFNGRETAPKKAHSKMFLDKNGQVREFSDVVQGGLAVGTPGLLKILKESHEKYGKLPWAKLFEPAIKIASQGFIMNDRLHILSNQITYLKNSKEAKEIYFEKDGNAKAAGQIITNKKLAQTFELLAKNGIDPFYKGKIAKDIVVAVQSSRVNKGYLSLQDLYNYQSKKGSLICIKYRNKYKICSMPLPSSGGITLLQILGILENFDFSQAKFDSVDIIHTVVEATRLAYADRNEYIADSENVPLKQMLDKTYLKSRANLIDKDRALEKIEPGKFKNIKNLVQKNMIAPNKNEPPSTTHLSIIDQEGNAVALTSSIEYFFGSGLVVDGFMLNNQMTDFSLTPQINGKKVANHVQPNKQPRSSMSPSFVFDENDKLLMVLGSPGGPRIIQFTLKTIINYLDFKMDIQQAISAPNYVVLNDIVELEQNTKITNLRSQLESMGHKTKIIEITSGINAVAINDNQLSGGADPRRQGFVAYE